MFNLLEEDCLITKLLSCGFSKLPNDNSNDAFMLHFQIYKDGNLYRTLNVQFHSKKTIKIIMRLI